MSLHMPEGYSMEKHLRRRAVEEITGLSRSTIYDLMARGLFPRPVKLTEKAVAWPESAVRIWLEERAAHSGKAA
jgi:prophage regulatory protein